MDSVRRRADAYGNSEGVSEYRADPRWGVADLVIADGKVVKSVYGDGFFTAEAIDDPGELIDLVRDLIGQLSNADSETEGNKSEIEREAYVTLGKPNDLWKAVGSKNA